MNTLRVVFVSNFYPPHERGGYEQSCRDVAHALRARGHEVVVVTSDYQRPAVRGTDDEQDVHRVLRTEVDWRPWLGSLGLLVGHHRRTEMCVRRLRDVLRTLRPQVICVWGMWNLPGALLQDLESRRAPPVCYYISDYWPTLPSAVELHLASPARTLITRVPKALLRQVVSRKWGQADHQYQPRFACAMCVSQAVRDRLVSSGIPVAGARVVPNGIDPTAYVNVQAQPASALGPQFEIVYAGRLDPSKGVASAIRAFALSRASGFSARLHVAGSGDPAYERSLRDLVQRAGVGENVKFHGWLSQDQLVPLLGSADAFVAPYEWPEPLPLVVQQAMLLGRPVVASRVGGLPELVTDGVDGLLVPPGRPDDLAAALLRLADAPDLCRRLGTAARATILERFTVSRMTDGVEDCLRSCVVECDDQPPSVNG